MCECQRVHNIARDSVEIVSSYNGWLYSNSSGTSLCVVIQNPADVLSPTHPRSPTDLLMVHNVCVSIADI